MNDSPQAGKTRWAHDQIADHSVWIAKYRRRLLIGAVQKACKALVAECCEHKGLRLLAQETDQDHIHVFVSAPPRFSPANIANRLKGYTSRYLRRRFPRLAKATGRDQLWTRAYYVGTAGSVTAQTIRRYITKSQGQ